MCRACSTSRLAGGAMGRLGPAWARTSTTPSTRAFRCPPPFIWPPMVATRRYRFPPASREHSEMRTNLLAGAAAFSLLLGFVTQVMALTSHEVEAVVGVVEQLAQEMGE